MRGVPLGDWILMYHDRTYLRQANGTYTLRRQNRDQRPHRPAPAELMSPDSERNHGRVVVGEYPSLPAVMMCPGCYRPACIAIPEGH
jgi:hypothetical protein